MNYNLEVSHLLSTEYFLKSFNILMDPEFFLLVYFVLQEQTS